MFYTNKILYLIGVLHLIPRSEQQNLDLIGSLLNSKGIERLLQNDELNCLPRLACEAATRRKTSSFSMDPGLIDWLENFVESPMWNLARGVLIGVKATGDIYECWRSFPKCPRDENQLLYYLNNHRGGFFRGFQHPYYRNEGRIVNKGILAADFTFSDNFRDSKNFVFEKYIAPVEPNDRLPVNAFMKFPNDEQGKNYNFFPTF